MSIHKPLENLKQVTRIVSKYIACKSKDKEEEKNAMNLCFLLLIISCYWQYPLA